MFGPFFVEAVGTIAAVCTTLCWLPQTLRVLRERDTSSLSLVTFATLVVGIVLWLAYGLMIGSWPLIFANLLTLVLNGTILAMKLRHG